VRYAFGGAAKGALNPYINILNRLVVVQFEDFEGALRTLVWEPTVPEGSAEAPFYEQLIARFGEWASYNLLAKEFNTVEGALASVGLAPEDVDFVSFDHLHVQDLRITMGTTEAVGDDDDPRDPFFPNARFVFQSREVDTFKSVHPTQWAWYVPGGMDHVRTDNLVLVDGDVQLGPGVALLWTSGHTDGNHSLCINTPEGVWVSSENGVSADNWHPHLSKIPGVRKWAEFYGQEHVNFAPLFGHQYSHVWVDFRGIRDPYMRERGGLSARGRQGMDYFENSRRATMAQRAYAMAGALSGITAYLAMRFRPSFAAGAAVATAHDLIVTVAALNLAGYDLDLTGLGAEVQERGRAQLGRCRDARLRQKFGTRLGHARWYRRPLPCRQGGTQMTTARFRVWGRRAFLVGVPIATALVIFQHPPDPSAATDLAERAELYLWIHVALLFMLPMLGVVVWSVLRGLRGGAATTARLLLPVALVFYAAFDSLVGIGAGLLSREAMAMTGEARGGAEGLAARWMEIPLPMPIISTIAVVSWSAALVSAAVAHWRAGSSWIVVIGLAIAGPLFGFGHPYITGVIGMAGLAVAVIALELGLARRTSV
jgi:hypothetical protein